MDYTYTSIPDTFSNLKLIEVVGEGTFGVVHKAVWRGTVVAAKVVNVPHGSTECVMKELEMCRCFVLLMSHTL